jgi:hypothetical protein
MSLAPLRATMAALAALTLAPGGARAEPLRMPADAVRAFQDFDEAAQKLGRVRAALASLESRDRPGGTARDWAGMAEGFAAAAEGLKRSEGPGIPEARSQVTQEQLRSCGTRQGALARLERQVRILQGGAQRCADTRAVFRDRLAAAQGAEDGRKAAARTADRLDEPAVAEALGWRWADVDRPLAASIAAYAGELRRHQERVDRGQAELKARAAQLSGWLEEYGAARDCILAGQWAGVRQQAGAASGLTLHLTASGSSWSGSANLDGVDVPVRGVTMSGSAVSITLGDRRATMNGAISGDGRSFKGSFMSVDGPGTFSLRKQ